MVRESRLREAAARGFEAARVYQEAALPCRYLANRNRADGQQGQDKYLYGASGNRNREEGRGNRQAQARYSEADEGTRLLYQYPRGAAPRSRSATGGREYRAAARAPRRVSARDEGSGHAGDAHGC